MRILKRFIVAIQNLFNYEKALKKENEELMRQVNELEQAINIFQEEQLELLMLQINKYEKNINNLQQEGASEFLQEQAKKMKVSFCKQIQSSFSTLNMKSREEWKNLNCSAGKCNKNTILNILGRSNYIIPTIVLIAISIGITVINLISLQEDLSTLYSYGECLIGVSKIAEIAICEELIFHTGMLSKYDSKGLYLWGTRLGVLMLAVILALCFCHNNTCDCGIYNLSNMATILSGVAFGVTIWSNYKEYSLPKDKKKTLRHRLFKKYPLK